MIDTSLAKEKKAKKTNSTFSKSKQQKQAIRFWILLPFTLLMNCLAKIIEISRINWQKITKKPKAKKRYQKITFHSTNDQEIVKISINHPKSSKPNSKSNEENELFSPNISDNFEKKNVKTISKEVRENKAKEDEMIEIPPSEEIGDSVFKKALHNLKKVASNRKHIIFQKVVFGNGNNYLKKKASMPATEVCLEKFEEINKKYMNENIDQEMQSSKELAEVLMDKLRQPIILRNKKILLKVRPKKKSFVPSRLTPIYEDLDYC